MELELIQKLALQAAGACGLELYHLEWHSTGRKGILRVFLDKPGGINVGDCERFSREIDVLLDVEDPIKGRYFLEVSSPGINRQLYVPEHYHRQVGQQVEIKTRRANAEGRKKWIGLLLRADEAGFILQPQEGGELPFLFQDVESGQVKAKI